MVAVTYGVARVGEVASPKAARAADAAPRKGLLMRFFDALVESRMEQARREIRMHSRLLPYTVDADGNVHIKTAAERHAGRRLVVRRIFRRRNRPGLPARGGFVSCRRLSTSVIQPSSGMRRSSAKPCAR